MIFFLLYSEKGIFINIYIDIYICFIIIVFKKCYMYFALCTTAFIRLFHVAVIVRHLTSVENSLEHDFFKNCKVATCIYFYLLNSP